MDKICAGIVLYQPDINRLFENVKAIYNQVEKLYFVDNGSSNIEKVKTFSKEYQNITVIENGKNLGIAKALNQLCCSAIAEGFDWIVTLDQDSVVYSDMVEKMLPFLSLADTAIIAPTVDDDYENNVIRSVKLNEIEDITRCNTSGCMTNLHIFQLLGGFDERMFIDCVDFDYCTTALKNGYRVARANYAMIHHRLGTAKEVKFFAPIGRALEVAKLKQTFYTYNHSPLRTYYYARNILYYMYKHKDFIDMKQERRTYIRWFVLKVFFEKQKLKKLWAIIKGTAHSFKLKREYKKEKKGRLTNNG